MPDPEFEQFPNPPIDEAVIDFRIGAKDGDHMESLDELAELLSHDYPERTTLKVFEGRIHVDEEEAHIEAEPGRFLGFMVRSEDERRFAQLKSTGVTFGHLKPYENWDALFTEGWTVWEQYLGQMRPESVTRVATRFVNRLELPMSFSTEDYSTTPIAVPAGLPDDLVSFNYLYVMDAGDDTGAGCGCDNQRDR